MKQESPTESETELKHNEKTTEIKNGQQVR